ALRRELKIQDGDDTDPGHNFTIEPVACLGCCTLAPVVKVDEKSFGHVTAEKVSGVLKDFLNQRETPKSKLQTPGKVQAPNSEAKRGWENLKHILPSWLLRAENGSPAGGKVISIGLGSCCMAKGSDRLFHELQQTVAQTGANAVVKPVGCVGICHRTPLVEVSTKDAGSRFYSGLAPRDARELVLEHFRPRGLRPRLSRLWNHALDSLLLDQKSKPLAEASLPATEPGMQAFLGRQVHIATEHFGKLDPLSLDEYVGTGGFTALARCLGGAALPAEGVNSSPEEIIKTIEDSGLRGRGGAGFPTGPKWRMARTQPGQTKYVICNGDEGDPGAFMDRMLLESFPFRIIEGLAIAAVAVGAHEGIFYIRHEYPLAVQRIRAAIKLCQKRGWLGERLLGADYPLTLTIKEGAGAFVCGEETALTASIEGKRGMPRLRPPFPVQQGLWGKPTVINNVETLALVPWIVRHGSEAFAKCGTARSKGTKVFALAGNIQRGGLIEIPMGTTLQQIVQDIGGGVPAGRKFKAVQIGGPSGGCIPARLADTPVDYESLGALGAIMGSGGLIVLDDTACMVDMARYFLDFTQKQSCGKCTFCRVGTRRMLDILERLCGGKGQKKDLEELERLGKQVGAGSLCGLGKTAPNPVLTTLRYFRDEYEAHLQGRCPARKCTALIQYNIRDNCVGCTLCAQRCPVGAIPMTPYQRHSVDNEKCTRCDSCRQVCPYDAVEVG
ncbi:MAG TPA: NADH-ubiquinone oxidoreductase-F iron-sulfur binding region domain-containing protein, partial [Candidatus Dormibacteraeota bacterium]|nr:NADH-ubiquinone oxidoreductase-F iron-sulfur binding region domain-containing protein [Candidatus Dormibacteraeota bacterium]